MFRLEEIKLPSSVTEILAIDLGRYKERKKKLNAHEARYDSVAFSRFAWLLRIWLRDDNTKTKQPAKATLINKWPHNVNEKKKD